jgi:methylmalonyl-CoA mutase C-terminal domain/subunit
MDKKIRVLVAKPGLDGHDRGAKVIVAAMRDAGFEVIYAGLRQTPEMIVETAIQEDVDVVALSILSGAHMTIFPRVLDLMKANEVADKLLTGGGIIPEDDMKKLSQLGVGRLFGPGSSTKDVIAYISAWFAGRS